MGSTQEFVDYVIERFDADCGVTCKKMFGEYGLFSDGKMFGMVCDDRLFFKQTEGGRAYVGDITEAPPYPGAKPIFLIEDRIDDGEWLSELARITTRELPVPRKRNPKRKK
ncbi:MAG: TfoX/Sxy family protein [Gemmatimonadota bacterium]|nr:TfoX/Sxy family protein [Gemmatimonadota bacterium]MDH5760864.1 TfoX/Sxy family protein [Gemmatimonadota bacterium]